MPSETFVTHYDGNDQDVDSQVSRGDYFYFESGEVRSQYSGSMPAVGGTNHQTKSDEKSY